MGKSSKKSASKAAAGAVVAAPAPAPAPAPAKPSKKGKREAEVVLVEKELASAKKQKVVAGNKSEKKVVKKKVESDASESEQKPQSPAAKKAGSIDEEKKPAPKKKRQSTGSGSETLLSRSKTLFIGNLSYDVQQVDIEEFFKPAGEVVAVRLATKREDGSFRGFGHVELATANQAEKALRELNGKKMLQRAVKLDQANRKPTERGGQGKDHSQPIQRGPKPGALFVKGFYSKEGEHVIRSSLKAHFSSCGEVGRISIPTDEDGNSKGFAYIQFLDDDSRNKALALNGSEFENGSLTVDETGRKGERNSGRGSKTLFVGNLSFDVQQADVEEFFGRVGEVVSVRFATNRKDDSFRGFGYVEFATAEQAGKAFQELNGKKLLQRAVNLDLDNEKPAERGQGKQKSQRGSKRKAVFVKGFDSSEGEDKIKSSLTAHFSPCGEIARIFIPADEDGNSKGFAFVHFLDDDSCNKALALNGSEFENGSLSVVETKPKGEFR